MRKASWGALLLVVSVVLGTSVFVGVERWYSTNLHPVIPGAVYRSGQPDVARLKQLIAELELRSILSLRGGDDSVAWFKAERQTAEAHGVEFRSLRLSGTHMPAPELLASLVDAISELPRPLLLHCRGGAERSALASAVVLLLDGSPPEVAARQFAARFGFIHWRGRSTLPSVVDDYASDLRRRDETHSPARFRRWLERGYVAEAYRAELEFVGDPQLRAGEGAWLSIRATNRSPRPWRFDHDLERGMHVVVRARSVDSDTWRGWSKPPMREIPAGEVAPGETVRLDVWLKAFSRSGAHRLEVDLENRSVARFSQKGSNSAFLDFDVAAASATPAVGSR